MRTSNTSARASELVVFLDRDGVINENRDDHVKSWQEFRFLPGALDALRLLTQRGFRIFIVTNQAAVNRGLVASETIELIHRQMVSAAAARGARIRDIRYCPHRPDEQCACRKPAPGMLLSLAAEHHIQTQRAFLVGDAITDLMAGQAVGCRTVLVRTGRGAAAAAQPNAALHAPEHSASNLLAAARWITAQVHPLAPYLRPVAALRRRLLTAPRLPQPDTRAL